MLPRVEIIILNWNGLSDTIACITSLKNISYPNYSIVVVDNCSDNNEAAKISAAFPSIEVIKSEKNLGFVGGNNLILDQWESRKADYFLLLNNDTIVDSLFLIDLVTAIKSDKNIGIAGPLILNFHSRTPQSAGASINLYTGSATIIPKLKQNTPYSCDMVSGCCFLIKSEVIKKIGSLTEEYFAYYEETDFCIRARKNGFKSIIVPSAQIEHKGGATSNKVSGFHEFQMIKNRLIFIRRNGTYAMRISTFLYLTFFYLWARSFRLIIGGNSSGIKALFSGYKKGLIGYFNPTS